MKRVRIASVATLMLLTVLAVSCATDTGASGTTASAALPGATTTSVVTSASATTPSNADPALTTVTTESEPLTASASTTERAPMWSLRSLPDLDALLTSADGYAYYYICDPIPLGLAVTAIWSELDMSSYSVDFGNGQKQPIVFMVSTLTEQLREGLAGVDQMLVDGETYYCSEEFDDKGGLLASSFQWVADGHLYYANPQEPVTPEVVRKYSHLKKAEFNVGESQVGLDTGIPLVSDPDDIERIDRDNEGIKYFTGPFPRL